MKRKTVSFCMICYNDESDIGMSLKSALAITDEIIVVDLGSNDNTRLVAEGYGARVIDFDFKDNYAKARNMAIAEASCDWILVLNPNERLTPISPNQFQRLLEDDVAGYNINVVSLDAGEPIVGAETVRLFRNHKKVRYRYRVREKVAPSLLRWANEEKLKIEDTDIATILHDTDKVVGISNDRAHIVQILRKAIIDNPGSPYFDYAVACEFLVSVEGEVLPINSLNLSLLSLEKAWQKVLTVVPEKREQLDYLSDLMIKLSACYVTAGQASLAWQMIIDARKYYPNDRSVLLQYAAVGVNYLRQCIRDPMHPEAQLLTEGLYADIKLLDSYESKREHLLRYLGELALFTGKVHKAKTFFDAALDINRDYSYAWLGLAQCQLHFGNIGVAISCCLEAIHRNRENYLAWLEGSQLLEKIGFSGNAATWRKEIEGRFPGLLESRVAN
ncbi:glycosyltransferase [Candidatus Parcubacteria bacterium]|nr:glycosyltransferase [Candidatus Parcubacteria bacterium]